MYNFDVLEVKDFDVIKSGTKTIYNLDGKLNYLDEIKKRTKYEGTRIQVPNMYGSLNFRSSGSGVFYTDSLGFLVCEGDTIESNPSSVFIISGPSYRNRGVNINKSNFLSVLSYFSARLSIQMDWKNQKDPYVFSEDQTNDTEIYDTIVYSLFNNSSFQCAAKSVEHNGNTYNINNQFFWISKEKVKQMCDEIGYDEMYNNVRIDSERYVYEILFGELNYYQRLSPEAKTVIDSATKLFERSLSLRQAIGTDVNQLNVWDAGYSQLKSVWKEFFSQEFKEFRDQYRVLNSKMEERTYRLGFLS